VQGILSSIIASLLQDCRAVSAVEFAITTPLLIGMLIPLVDLGLGIAKSLSGIMLFFDRAFSA
jgi:Flp pilus assembly protein TadG